MLKKTIEYTNYNGVKVKEDFYFNLTKAEIVELEGSVKGGLVATLHQALKDGDTPLIMKYFRDIIRKAYGEKTPDGKYFMKTKIIGGEKVELADLFEQTPAYSELYMELLTSDDASDKFMRAVIPADTAASLPANTRDALPDDIKAVLSAQN